MVTFRIFYLNKVHESNTIIFRLAAHFGLKLVKKWSFADFFKDNVGHKESLTLLSAMQALEVRREGLKNTPTPIICRHAYRPGTSVFVPEKKKKERESP